MNSYISVLLKQYNAQDAKNMPIDVLYYLHLITLQGSQNEFITHLNAYLGIQQGEIPEDLLRVYKEASTLFENVDYALSRQAEHIRSNLDLTNLNETGYLY